MIKDFSISFSRVIVVQEFETVTTLLLDQNAEEIFQGCYVARKSDPFHFLSNFQAILNINVQKMGTLLRS